jgi:CO/xanthine dehydrogenase Mo-binding subunit
MQTLTPGSILGHAVRRREDPRLITGAGRYVDHLQPDHCLHVTFVRSALAHATIRAVDVAAATAVPSVIAVFTAANLELPARVGFQMVPDHACGASRSSGYCAARRTRSGTRFGASSALNGSTAIGSV